MNQEGLRHCHQYDDIPGEHGAGMQSTILTKESGDARCEEDNTDKGAHPVDEPGDEVFRDEV